MVVEGSFGHTPVLKIYVDTGSAVEVMYEHYFRRLETEVRAKLRKPKTWLQGFLGNMSYPIGEIDLPLTLEDHPKRRTEVMTFSVIRAESPYDVILGRSGLSLLQAILSPLHSLLKFPTPRGIATIHSRRDSRRASHEREPRPPEQGMNHIPTKKLIRTTQFQSQRIVKKQRVKDHQAGRALLPPSVEVNSEQVKKRSRKGQTGTSSADTAYAGKRTGEWNHTLRSPTIINMPEQATRSDESQGGDKSGRQTSVHKNRLNERELGSKAQEAERNGRQKLRSLIIRQAPESKTSFTKGQESKIRNAQGRTTPRNPA